MFDWDRNNLRKIRAHKIERDEAEEAMVNSPIAIYEQDVEGEARFLYYGETNSGRLLALLVTPRGEYLERRVHGSTILPAIQSEDPMA